MDGLTIQSRFVKRSSLYATPRLKSSLGCWMTKGAEIAALTEPESPGAIAPAFIFQN